MSWTDWYTHDGRGRPNDVRNGTIIQALYDSGYMDPEPSPSYLEPEDQGGSWNWSHPDPSIMHIVRYRIYKPDTKQKTRELANAE